MAEDDVGRRDYGGIEMLIVISGLIGVGKSAIAKEVSRRLNIPLYSIDEDKKKVYSKYPKNFVKLKEGIPMPDAARKECFHLALKELKKLAKQHKHIIVEETFHQKITRDPFLKKAKELFNGMILTIVTANKKSVKKRIEKRGEHMANHKLAVTLQKRFDPFDLVDYTIKNNGKLEEVIVPYVEFLKEKIR